MFDFLFPARRRARERRRQIQELDWKIQALAAKAEILGKISELPMVNSGAVLEEAANTKIEMTILRRKMVQLLEWDD